MIDGCGDNKFGVVSYGRGGLGAFSPRKVSYFSTPRAAFLAFSETDFWIHSVTLYCK